MKTLKKICIRFLILLLVLIPLASFAHYLIFPQQTRSILVDYSGLQKKGRIYYAAQTPMHEVDSLNAMIQQASKRITENWGKQTSDPKFIYCASEKDFKKYGSPVWVPAVTHLKLGAVIVLNKEQANLDVIAHEMAHAELFSRIGFYQWNFKIPKWFDEGLAMQHDFRSYYSDEAIRLKSDNYKNLPDVGKLETSKAFYGGTADEVVLNFMAAKLEVRKWFTPGRLQQFLSAMNSGKSFNEAYSRK